MWGTKWDNEPSFFVQVDRTIMEDGVPGTLINHQENLLNDTCLSFLVFTERNRRCFDRLSSPNNFLKAKCLLSLFSWCNLTVWPRTNTEQFFLKKFFSSLVLSLIFFIELTLSFSFLHLLDALGDPRCMHSLLLQVNYFHFA